MVNLSLENPPEPELNVDLNPDQPHGYDQKAARGPAIGALLLALAAHTLLAAMLLNHREEYEPPKLNTVSVNLVIQNEPVLIDKINESVKPHSSAGSSQPTSKTVAASVEQKSEPIEQTVAEQTLISPIEKHETTSTFPTPLIPKEKSVSAFPETSPKESLQESPQLESNIDREHVINDKLEHHTRIERHSEIEHHTEIADHNKIKSDMGVESRSVPASLMSHINGAPQYPLRARKRGYQGEVLLEVDIGEDGRPLEIYVIQSSGYPILDKAAIKTVLNWRFNPARQGTNPIASSLQIPIKFVLKG